MSQTEGTAESLAKGGAVLDNGHLKVIFSSKGRITSIWDYQNEYVLALSVIYILPH